MYENKYDFTFLTDVVFGFFLLGQGGMKNPSDADFKSYEHCSGVHQMMPFKQYYNCMFRLKTRLKRRAALSCQASTKAASSGSFLENTGAEAHAAGKNDQGKKE